ncbi:MAG: hypothetical protein WBZ50_07860 [Nitrososphaeraceae archaeon]
MRSLPFCLVLASLSGTSDKNDIRPLCLNAIIPRVIMIRIDLIRLNEILDKLAQNKFFENYAELKDFYEYLAGRYHFDINTHAVDPATGEIIPLKD